MLVSVLPVPFGDAGRQRQYEAVLAALQAAAADAPATVLLGNLGAFSPIEADVLIVRPTGLALVLLTPHAGHLTMPALGHGPWQLGGQPLPGRAGADNPFVQYQQQLPGVLAWLSKHLDLPADELPPCLGVALFEAPLTFGLEVEAQLHQYTAGHDFQLVGGTGQLLARLRQSPAAEPAALSEDELLDWGEYLADDPYVAHQQGAPESPFAGLPAYLEQKLRQLWRWLGAEDIPADPPYGGGPPDPHLRDQQEQARLQQLRRELQAELHQQRQEAATREAARTQELALLRQQLTQAGPSPTEQQAKKALEEALGTARAELATRNHELDARIQRLGQLIEQLRAAPAPAAPAATVPPAARALAPKPRAATPPAWSFRRLRQAERWGLVLLAVASVGVGIWGGVRWVHQPAPRPTAAALRGVPVENNPEQDQPTESYVPDSLANAQAAAIDTLTTPTAEPILTNAEPEPTTTNKEAATSEEATPAEATPVSTEAETPTPAVPTTTAEPAATSPEAVPEPSPTP